MACLSIFLDCLLTLNDISFYGKECIASENMCPTVSIIKNNIIFIINIIIFIIINTIHIIINKFVENIITIEKQ
jgi:uncharacterized integral membrane protein